MEEVCSAKERPEIRIMIPGEPVAQGRGRAFGYRRHDGTIGARVFDPEKSRNWKAAAGDSAGQAMQGAGFSNPLAGNLRVEITARFTCPRSQWRKREPLQERPHGKRPDAENVAKAVLDAMTGTVYLDDSQVAELVVIKRIAAQGAAPGVEVVVREIATEG